LRSSLFRRLLLTASLCLTLTAQADIQQGEPQALKDLHYGEVLFQLYQENHFHAIVHLLAARKQGLMTAYEGEPELLLGGLYLAYGMPDTAESLFEKVLAQSASEALQGRAWLQLAKARHRRNESVAAQQALSKAAANIAPQSRDESVNLKGLLQILSQNNAEAVQTLAEFSDRNDWSSYGQYNRAIALIRAGEREQGMTQLDNIGSEDADSDETRSIRDRANLLLGYLALESEQPEKAFNAFQRIRLSSPASSQALLGAGWAALKQNQPKQALIPWQTLAKRSTSESAVLEVQLAIPFALAQLEAEQQSLQGYQDAIERYNASIQDLDGVITQIRQDNFPHVLLQTSGNSTPPPELLALKAQLPILLSKNEFIERLQDYRDLRQLERNLVQWQEKISTYRDMLSAQLAAYSEQSPKVDAYLSGNTLHEMEQERDELQAQYDRAASPEEPPFILTTADEKSWLARLDRIDTLLAQHAGQKSLQAQEEVARLMRGILVWRSVSEHPQRLWTLEKHMSELDQALEKTRKIEAGLAQVRRESTGRFENYARRIEALESEIPSLIEKVGKLRRQERGHLQQMAVETLEQRKALMHNYLIQARFGVASLLDSSSAKAPEEVKP
jgi:outer membrane protein assembly factor BamD (BamD/ComL family)